jgi:hypothetical protein
MLGLPKSTEINRKLPTTSIYAKFAMSTSDRAKFDADIRRIAIVNEVSPATMNISVGKIVSAFYVLHVTLRSSAFDKKTIQTLSKMIGQRILFVLENDGKACMAVCHTKLMQSEWKPVEELKISLAGLNLDAVWENVIVQVGEVDVEKGKTLDDQLAIDAQREKLQKQISALENKVKREKQFNRQVELNGELKRQMKELEKL